MNQNSKILGHAALFDSFNNSSFQLVTEVFEFLVSIEVSSVEETSGPGEDGGNRVGGSLLAALVLAVVAGHRAVRGLGLHCPAVRRHQHRRHEAERAEALRHRIGLHVAIIVLAGPDIAARPLQACGHHVVDQPVFVGELLFLELVGKFGIEHLLKDVLEAAVIGLEDRVLRRKVDRIATLQAVVEGSAGEIADGLVEIVHGHGHAGAGCIENLVLYDLAILADELDGELAFPGKLEVGRAVLIAIGVAADDDRLGPAGHEPRHVLADDRLAEDGAAEDVADGAVRRLPHFLQIEFLHAGFVRRDGGAFDADAMLQDGMGAVDGDLIVGLVTVLDAEIVVEEIDVEIGKDQLLFDELPDDAGHLVAVELDDGSSHLDFLHIALTRSRGLQQTWRRRAEPGTRRGRDRRNREGIQVAERIRKLPRRPERVG